MPNEEIYADSIGGIAVTGPVVRFDLYSLSPTEVDENKKPKPVFRQRVIMPIEGFVQSFGLMAQVMQQFEKSGVIQKTPPKEDDKGATASGKAADKKPTSSNFK